LLILALIPSPISIKTNGARRWLGWGRVRFQPSELSKLALILVLAHYGEHYYRRMHTMVYGLLWPGALTGGLLALVFLEPDWGNTVLLGAVAGIILLLAGLRWRFIVLPALLISGGFIYLLLHNPMRMARVMAWLDPATHKEGSGYQAWQAMLAMASGGIQGVGLGDGRQKQGFIPEHQTDFIFSIIGEELGLVATLGVILAFMVLVICAGYISWNASSRFGFLLGSGLTFLIGMQAFINVGVVTSLLPSKGLPLPFISYGGSNLLLMMTSIGILFSIAIHSEATAEVWGDFPASPGPAALPF
jgi:cell division protein FtsW